MSTKSQQLIDLDLARGAHNYRPIDVVLQRAKGIHLWDVAGRRYTDMMSAYSTASLGHSHPKVLKALARQAKMLDVTSRAFYNDQLPLWLDQLTALAGMDKALPMNTGAEAVETALKLARKWGETIKGIPRERGEIIGCEGNFHGRTLALVSLSTEAQYRENFGPYLPGFKTVPFGDVDALAQAITPRTAAFIVEPIQGEAGIRLPPPGYLKRARELCRQHRVLFIVDEIQCGLSRTGRLFCFQHEDLDPDLLILGKALGGGVYPVSAVVGSAEVLGVLRPGDHGSTFGGNAIAAAVSMTALTLLSEPEFIARVARLGDWALAYLQAALGQSPIVRDIRGQGLMMGIEIVPELGARGLVDALKERGVLTKETHDVVIRLAPPLIIRKKQLRRALDAVIDVVLSAAPPG
ncbi:MAG: ornithine--oxo-acid transaminase [Aquabacterium sp.]|uniref:ornithine--oxo-acid transaminase n=1 Tax=Aquabacterium sp. TaxID=1872578 RepID=UPI00271C52BA|nr:ornithine--oxo-acid transaminase [Aquabacterium sp.]MDO9005559.1 ornithine--oxo-acid transaminase [Aquabacterium sp.]